jgi:uncharacterized SAM-binding protein YcdF (DUF218 family)
LSKKTGRRSRRWLQFLILAAAALVIFHESVFRYLAQVLITSETPEKSDIAIILAGDSFGERILKGCELIREGYAPKALVSGPKVFYGRHEDEFAIQWATDRGCDRDWFEGVPNELKSTKDEAQMFGRILRERGAKTYLLVTSDFHTARAARIFRKEIPDIRAVIVAAPYPEFDPNAWWKERQQRKVFVLEWLKTVTEPFGI